jgi:hypothetical protein
VWCGFNVTTSVYTLEGRPLGTIGENNQTEGAPITTNWKARRDIVVWNTDDKEGTIRCFPDVTSDVSETVYADGSSNVTILGSVLLDTLPDETVAEGVTTITKPGMFFQVDGITQATIVANGNWTYTKADGKYINVCELLSSTDSTPSPTPPTKDPPSSATTMSSAWLAVTFLMMLPNSAYMMF